MVKSSRISIILLAAGNSSRLGTPKQLLEINGTLLIEKIYQSCMASKAANIVVVTGANATQIEQRLNKNKPVFIENKNWENGMLSSIQTGLKKVLDLHPNTKGVLVVLCDQYFVETPVLNSIIDLYLHKEASAICCSYANTIGVPALYSNTLFDNLMEMDNQKGAKKLLLQLQKESKLDVIDFPKGVYDIDTKEQLEALKKML